MKEEQIDDSENNEMREHRSRSNAADQLVLDQKDMVVAFVRARISTLANVSIAGLETSQVLHYQVGQEFTAHCDYLDVSNPGHAQDVARHGQRALTVLIYLNDDYSGGDTAFPMLGRSFKGRKGDALIFWNLAQDGAPDGRTLHIGTAPTQGEKWLFSQWIRIPAS